MVHGRLAAPYTMPDAGSPRPMCRRTSRVAIMPPERRCSMIGATCFMPSITDRTSSAMAASKPAYRATLAMLPVGAGPPALLNRQSMRPKACDAAWSITRFQSVFEVAVGRKELRPLADPSGNRLAPRLAAGR